MPASTSYFTKENAREMSARAWEAKRQAAMLREQGEIPKPLLPDEKYSKLCLTRTRRNLDRVYEIAEKEDDPAALDRLASAACKFAELEHILRTGGKPGAFKPTTAKPKRSPGNYPEPVPQFSVMHEPQPANPGQLPQPSATPQVVSGDWATELF